MTDWKLAMLVLLLILQTRAQWRAWAIVMSASVAGAVWTGGEAYLAIDLVAALAFARRPGWERALCGLFLAMSALDVAVLVAPDFPAFRPMVALGWLQWAALLCWTLSSRQFRARFRESADAAVRRDDFDLMVAGRG